MNKILNPFEYLSNGKALGWGLAGSLLAIAMVAIVRWPVECNISWIVRILSTNLLLWLPLSALLYVAALIFSPSRIRAVDIFASNLFALLPTILVVGISNLIIMWLGGLGLDPGSFSGIMARALYNMLVIFLSMAMVWSMVWGCFAYSVSANMKGLRGVLIFVICYVFVSVVLQLLPEYI